MTILEVLELIKFLGEVAVQATKENRDPSESEAAATLAHVQGAVDRNRKLDPKN